MKVLNLEERKPQLLVFWFYGNVVVFGSVSDRKSSVSIDLEKVICNQLGRMPLLLWTQEGSFRADECFSLRQRSMSLPGHQWTQWCKRMPLPVHRSSGTLCSGFGSVPALKRKLRFPGKVKTSHYVGR